MGVPGLPLPALSWKRLRRLAIRMLRRVLHALRPLTGGRALEWHTRRFGSTDYLAAGELRQVFVRVVNEDLTEVAKAVVCPTLLLWGADDQEAPISLAVRYQHLIQGSPQLEILAHKDHHLYAATGAHLCASRIRSWLAGHVER
jgi:pimeloyl-ACP methyl ester carboxylesterase